MADNVIPLGVAVNTSTDPDTVLSELIGQLPRGVVVVGMDAGGQMIMASSYANNSDTLWRLQRGIRYLMQLADALDEDIP